MGYVLHTGFLRCVNANNCFQSADMIFGLKLNVKILTIYLCQRFWIAGMPFQTKTDVIKCHTMQYLM